MTRPQLFVVAIVSQLLCNVVVHFLKRSGFKVAEYHGGGRYEPIDKSSLAALNLHLALKAVEFVLLNVEREKVANRIFVMDRGLFDRQIFTEVLRDLGKIDQTEATVLLGLLRLPRLADHIDGLFLFVTQPDSSIAREYQDKLVKSPGRVMNTTFLESLRGTSLAQGEEWRRETKHVRIIDTSEQDGKIIECARLVADDILQIVGAQK
jgi:hypothetical protein